MAGLTKMHNMKAVEFISNIFSWICHQEPSRSIFTTNTPLLCARCSGIYTGALFWLVGLWSLSGKHKSVLKIPYIAFMIVLVGLTPMEFLLEKVGLDGGNWFRYWLGILSGIGLMGLCHLQFYTTTGKPKEIPQNITYLVRMVFLCAICAFVTIYLYAENTATSLVLPALACIGFVVFVSNLAISIFRLFFSNRNT